MTRVRLIALFAAVLMTPALAQVMRVPRVAPPPVVQDVEVAPRPDAVSGDAPAFDVASDPERARALINKLNQDKRELKLQLNDSNAKLNDAVATLDQWTKKGGSLVHAYCASETLSRRSDGAGDENCEAAGGYRCSAVEGTCHRSCTVTDQCAPGYICDTCHSKCVSSSAEPPQCG